MGTYVLRLMRLLGIPVAVLKAGNSFSAISTAFCLNNWSGDEME